MPKQAQISDSNTKSLYRELTLALVILVSVVSIGVSLLNYYYSAREADADFDNKVAGYTAHLRDSLEWPLWNVDNELIEKVGKAFSSNEEIAALTIRDDLQHIVYQHKSASADQLTREFPIEHNGRVIGKVEIGLSLHAYESKNRWLLLNSIATALLLIISLLGMLRWILKRLLKKPVDALTNLTAQIVDGKYLQIEHIHTYTEFSPIVSGLKTMSDAIANREANLRASEQKLLSILESVDACIYLKDTDGKYLFANRSVRELWNVSMEDIIGYGDEKFFNAATVEILKQNDKQVLIGGELIRSEEVNTVPSTGKTFHYQSTKLPLRREDGSIYALCGISVDITERKRTEEELRRYKNHLEEEVEQRTADLVLARNAAEAANLAKSVFLSSMSHELRTPLNAVLGFSGLMRKDPELTSAQRANLDIINRSGEHLLTLINDVLEMAKIEAGRTQLENSPFDLGLLVRDVADMMGIRAKEKNLRLLIDQSSQFPRYINGDEARLRQILINLIGNAIKFTQQGGITVRLGTRNNSLTHLVIEIEDSGMGISTDDQHRLFQPFVQLGKQAGENKGSGLGLAITQQFVKLMGGSIHLESTLGKGSLFRVELPLNEASEKDFAQPETLKMGEVIGIASGQPQYRILIIEDSQENQLLLSRLMENIGLEVKIAADGASGVELFKDWQPHLIWMDRRMPIMDGMEATKRIRELPGGKEVKIVAVTASAFMEQREEMLKAGMDDFVRKPYRFNEIYEMLSKQLGVQYRFKPPELKEETFTPALTTEMLAILPSELRNELGDALTTLDSERINNAIHQVANHNTKLQKTLTHLVENFDYPSILKALNRE